MKRVLIILTLTLLGGVFAFSTTVLALSIRLDDGAGDMVTISDGSPLDFISTAGVVGYNGTIGGWTTNITTGISKPEVGSADYPILHLNSVDISSTTGGLLNLWISDNDYVPNDYDTGFNLLIGGITNGSLSVDAYADSSNNEFGQEFLISSLGPFGSGAFSGTGYGHFQSNSNYSLTMLVSLTHEGAGITSFDAQVNPVPEPATMFLFGTGLIGLAGFSRKKFFKK